MSAPKFDPALVEQAARAARLEGFYGTHGDRWNDQKWQAEFWEAVGRAVLSAVAPTLRAEGAAENERYAKELERRIATINSHGERAELIAERDSAYQRGKVEGVRQVLAAVEAMVAEWGQVVPPLDPPRATVSVLAAAREAVARIEGGA